MNENRTTNLLLGILVALAVGFLLLALRGILLPLFVAMFLSYLAMPAVRLGKRLRIPVAVSLVVILVLFALAIGTLGKTVYSSGIKLVQSLPEIEEHFRPWVIRALQLAKLPDEVIPSGGERIDWQEIATSPLVLGYARAGVGNLLGWAGNLTLVLLFLVFIILDRGREALDRRIVTAFSAPGTDNARPVLERIHHGIERYIVTKTCISLLTGTLVWVILALFGVRFAFLFGALAFLLNFIPNVGSVIATMAPLLIAIVQFGSPWRIVILAVLLALVQLSVGNILEPLILGRTLKLNPITVLLSLVFWGWLWGLWGMVLAVPMAATARIILDQTPRLRAVGTLMGEA